MVIIYLDWFDEQILRSSEMENNRTWKFPTIANKLLRHRIQINILVAGMKTDTRRNGVANND